jgi:hypothetical protein
MTSPGYTEPGGRPVVGATTCAYCGKSRPVVRGAKHTRFCNDSCRKLCHDYLTRQTPHPVWRTVGLEDVRPGETFEGVVRAREEIIKAERVDPFRFGYAPPHWQQLDDIWTDPKLDELLLSGGNRSSKTTWAARWAVRYMLLAPDRFVLCCHTTHNSSVTVQQPAVYQWLPAEYRQTKKGRIHFLNYSRKNGFTDNSFVLPNGSRMDFLNYSQDPTIIEGREIDLVWCDELVPQTWVEACRYRLVSRRGKLLVTQTPLEGVASCWRDFAAGAKVTEWMDAPLLTGRRAFPEWPIGKVPRQMDGQRKGQRIFFFATKDNPFSPADELEKKLADAPIGTILTRAYGWPAESGGKAFPRFRPDVHCVPATAVPPGGTLYQVVDPAGARNFFCIWARVYKSGQIYVVREYPGYFEYGEWALPSDKQDGKPGPAQTAGAGRGIAGYRGLFRSMEHNLLGRPQWLAPNAHEEPMMRLIDPLAAATPSITEQGGMTPVDFFAQPGAGGRDADPEEEEPMAFVPAPKVAVECRIGAVNDLLAFDATRPMDSLNCPRLFVVEDCKNLIYTLSEHTGLDGQKGATKDPADCIGYLAVSDPQFVGSEGLKTIGGGTY